MIADWRNFVSLPDLLLMAGLEAVDLYLWISLGDEVRRRPGWIYRPCRFSFGRLSDRRW